MSIIRTFPVPGLATVTIDTSDSIQPLLTIRLSPDYRGDLNDIEEHNEFPPGIYLECDSTSCIDDPRLAKFMEVLTLWDHDHDGNFDADVIADTIEDAMWRSREAPNEFHRPNDDPFTRLLMRMLPPAPARHIVFSFGELRHRFRWYHYALAAPTILVILALFRLQIDLLPWTSYSVISGVFAIGEAMHINPLVAWLVFVFAWTFFKRRMNARANITSASNSSAHTYGFFNKAAIAEEQAFREGSENWTWSQRTMSCLVFGAIHIMNLIYPLATILPLALGGAVFMAVYLREFQQTKFRRSAVLRSALVHRVYNRLALVAFAISLVWYFGAVALAHFGIGLGTLFVMTFAVRFVDIAKAWFANIGVKPQPQQVQTAPVIVRSDER